MPPDASPLLAVGDLRAALGGPEARIVSIFGSIDLHHPSSEALCASIGRRLAEAVPDATVVTGANAAVHDLIARSFVRSVEEDRREEEAGGGVGVGEGEREDDEDDKMKMRTEKKARVFHLAPVGYRCDWTHGTVLTVGRDMEERRELLARVGDAAISVEGGPATADEMSKAWLWGVALVPVGRSGGASGGMFDSVSDVGRRPIHIEEEEWEALWDEEADVDVTARAVAACMKRFLDNR